MSDDSPAQLSTGDWRVILTRTWHSFRISQSYDIAGTLTYYGVLSIFPALLATLAAVGVFGSAGAGAKNVLQVAEDLGGREFAGAMQEPLEGLVDASHEYHLWVHADPNYQFPVGFQQRFVHQEPLGGRQTVAA